jgi:hypothetical protein
VEKGGTLAGPGLALRYHEFPESESLANSEIFRASPPEEGILRLK